MRDVKRKLRKIADEGVYHHLKVLELVKTILIHKINHLK
jgi:hypothetical protein